MVPEETNHGPLFGIGVTTYDRKEMLIECLRSIQGQDFSDYEVLIGNDNTQRIVSASSTGIDDARFRFINHPHNLGEMGNMNHLLEQSRARYFTWLADDDLFLPGALARMEDTIRRADYPSAVFTSYLQGESYNGEQASATQQAIPLSGETFLSEYLRGRLRLHGCYGFFRRPVVIQLGGMQKLGSGASPYGDVMLAIRSGGLEKVYYLPTETVFYRTHPGSSTLTSPDLDAFSSSQQSLLRESNHVFRSEALHKRCREFIYLLVDRVREDYFEVLRRSGRVELWKLIRFLLLIGPYLCACRGNLTTLLRNSFWSMATAIAELKRSRLLEIPFRIFKMIRRRRGA